MSHWGGKGIMSEAVGCVLECWVLEWMGIGRVGAVSSSADFALLPFTLVSSFPLRFLTFDLDDGLRYMPSELLEMGRARRSLQGIVTSNEVVPGLRQLSLKHFTELDSDRSPTYLPPAFSVSIRVRGVDWPRYSYIFCEQPERHEPDC